jgi:hypothetical protein
VDKLCGQVGYINDVLQNPNNLSNGQGKSFSDFLVNRLTLSPSSSYVLTNTLRSNMQSQISDLELSTVFGDSDGWAQGMMSWYRGGCFCARKKMFRTVDDVRSLL